MPINALSDPSGMHDTIGKGTVLPDLALDLEAAFRFLLDREPKESILRTFDLSVINSYFPEFKKTIQEYL